MGYVVGVDTGGTFTDTVVIDPKGEITIGKRPSTPPEFVEGVRDSVGDAANVLGLERGQLFAETDRFLHGTTIVVNAIVQGVGARIGLITTKGFGDTIFLARSMSSWAGLTTDRARRRAEVARPTPMIPASKRLVREVVERVDYKGDVFVPLNEDSARAAIGELLEQDIEALAVCLLWSFRNPAHELRIGDIAAELAPGLPVTLSSQLVPKAGEYERMATTGFNSAMSTIASEYLGRLSETLKSDGLGGALYVMQGNGGVLPIDEALTTPVNLIGSGPAGGVLGAKILADAMGIENVICTDVGGTSFDVGLIVDGQPLITPRAIVSQHTLHLPLVDVISIGAGGGSIARTHVLGGVGRLTVGPESAGARPGPVCYGFGGTEPTVTDADLVLGMIDPEYFLGGTMHLDVEGAREAIRTKIAEPLGMTVDDAAVGIVEIADSHMADLIRQMTVERGHDVREFAAFLYGGSGPLHGTAYAAKLGLKSLVVPGAALASVFSAFGIAAADVHYTLERTEELTEPIDPAAVQRALEELDVAATQRLADAGVPPELRLVQRFVEMRYGFQTHQVTVPVPTGPVTEATIAQLFVSFEAAYERLYGKGSGFREAGIEISTFRLQAYGQLKQPPIRQRSEGSKSARPVSARSVLWPETRERTETLIYRGSDLSPGAKIQGPAVVELPATTVAVRPAQWLEVDDTNNYLIYET